VGSCARVSADLLAGRYALGSVIGKGRSSVYSARDTRLGRDVAVKRVALAAGSDEVDASRARALREARAAARMSSSYVVDIYDVIEESDAVWLVMELVRAPSLHALVRRHGPLPAPPAAAVGLGVVDALAAAHAVGVLHRDVKPANVLVMAHADGGVTVKLADFGVAALRDESDLTVPGQVVGSPSYMAPEQASGRPVGPEADLWALGALLYFAVEGVPPFSAGSAQATASAVVHGMPRPPSHPGALTPVIDALLVKDRARRPALPAVRAALAAIAESRAAAAPLGAPLTAAVGWAGEDTVGLTAALSLPVEGTGRLLAIERTRPQRRRRVALAAAAAAALLGGVASQFVGVGAEPSRSGPPAAEAAQPADAPATTGPSTTQAPAPSGQRHAATAPAATGDPAVATSIQETPDQGAAESSPPTTATDPATATTASTSTTTLPDGSGPPSDPPDTAPTTTSTTTPPDTTTPTTAQPAV